MMQIIAYVLFVCFIGAGAGAGTIYTAQGIENYKRKYSKKEVIMPLKVYTDDKGNKVVVNEKMKVDTSSMYRFQVNSKTSEEKLKKAGLKFHHQVD